MSQPRRRRRRRRRPSSSTGERQPQTSSERQAAQPERADTPKSAASRRRRGRRGRARQPSETASYEDVIRSRRSRPDVLMRAPDGTTLEEVIGDLQSTWGVPESPQEFRITLRVAEERERNGRTVEEPREEPAVEAAEAERSRREKAPSGQAPADERPRREKAPAAPRISGESAESAGTEGRTRRRRRGRGRRGKKS